MARSTYGERLRRSRVWPNLKQRQLAKELGVSVSVVSDYENDHRAPTDLKAFKIDWDAAIVRLTGARDA